MRVYASGAAVQPLDGSVGAPAPSSAALCASVDRVGLCWLAAPAAWLVGFACALFGGARRAAGWRLQQEWGLGLRAPRSAPLHGFYACFACHGVPSAQGVSKTWVMCVVLVRATHAADFWAGAGGLWRVHLPRLPIPVVAPKRSASTSPEPSTAPSDAISVSSSDGEQLPAQQTTVLR
jgi:hypothetical protein